MALPFLCATCAKRDFVVWTMFALQRAAAVYKTVIKCYKHWLESAIKKKEKKNGGANTMQKHHSMLFPLYKQMHTHTVPSNCFAAILLIRTKISGAPTHTHTHTIIIKLFTVLCFIGNQLGKSFHKLCVFNG